jgi:hypothetical protein
MPLSQYLAPSDLAAYGLPGATTQAQIIAASVLIDAYLRRPEGLICMPDYLGLPCYMANPSPQMMFQSAGAVAPGINVVVPLTVQLPVYNDMIGDVVILDRTNPASTEACTISAMATGSITLASVSTAHLAGVKLETGLTIFEERPLPAKRSIMRVGRPPVRVLSGMGRCAYGRRSDQVTGMFNEINLLVAIQAFGGPPMWIPFAINQTSVSQTTREIWIPASIYEAYFSEVRLRYVSGWSAAGLPAAIKQATANIISTQNKVPEMAGQVSSFSASENKIARFAASMLDNDTRAMIDMYRITAFI